MVGVLIVRVIHGFSAKFAAIADCLDKSPRESAQDDHDFLVEITSNPHSSAQTPQTWLGTFREECLVFVKKYLTMWRNKGFVSAALCKSFDCLAERRVHFRQFAKGLSETAFAELLEEEYFLSWERERRRFLDKAPFQGLRRSVKNFVDPSQSLEANVSRSFFCKIQRFQEEASQLKNSAIERGREEGLQGKEEALKAGLMKAGFAKTYLAFLENEAQAQGWD